MKTIPKTDKCLECDSEYTTIHLKQKFCSMKCYQKYRKKHKRHKSKEYKHEWYMKNRNRLLKASRKSYQKHRKQRIAQIMELYNQRKNELLEKLGNRCFVCGKDVSKRPIFHEIHGKQHKHEAYGYALKHTEDFVVMCQPHHTTLHSYLKYESEFKKLLELIGR